MAIEDRFAHLHDPISGPPDGALTRFSAVTKSDTQDLAFVTRALLLSADGNVKVDSLESAAVTLPLVKGTNWIRAKRVYATGSDAVTVVAAD